MKSHFAIQSLYQDHKTWLANWFRRRVSSSDQPMDYVQDTFLRVLASERADEIDNPRAYLTVVARQLLIDRRRHQTLVEAYEAQLAAAEPAHAPSEEHRAIVRQTLQRLDALIQRLPEPVRLTLLLSRVGRADVRGDRPASGGVRAHRQALHGASLRRLPDGQAQPGTRIVSTPLNAASPPDPALVREAAQWLARVQLAQEEGRAQRDRELAAARRWGAQSPAHQRAWAAASELLADLDQLPRGLALGQGERAAALGTQRRQEQRVQRRRLLGVLGGVGITGALGTQLPWQHWAADQTTSLGQTRVLALAEPGASLVLNTSTSVDVDAARHRARLYDGEVLLSLPGPEADVGAADGWQVQAGAAWVQPQGRKVALSVWDGVWRVAALDGAVRLKPVAGVAAPAGLPEILSAGRAVQWQAQRAQAPGSVSPNDELWTQGLLLADAMPLGEFLRRFGRYHRAVLRCDPAVAQLAISGLYQLNDLPRMLRFVAARHPVAVRRVTDYWITLEQA